MRRLLVAVNAALALMIVWAAFYWQPEPDMTPLPGTHAARLVANVPPGGDFTLDGPRGAVALHDFAGKLVLLQFGYTYCPDVCPTSLAILAQALEKLSKAELAQVQAIFISVDPERDSVARLAEYVNFFHPSIIGLTGNPARLTEIAARYGVVFARQEDASAGSYVMDHTALTYLIDARGRLVTSLPHAAPAEQLLATIRNNLSTNLK